MSKLVSTLFWLAALGCASVPSAVQAGSTNLSAHGGTGGESFSIDCGADFVLVGVRARKKDWIEQITGLCTRLGPNRRWLGAVTATETVGGTGGGEVTVMCPRDTAVRGLRGRFGWYVNRMILRCRPLVSTVAAQTIRVDGSQTEQSWSYEFCANSKFARGFRGRAGWYIDRVGLKCHTNPTPNLQAAPSNIVVVNLVGPNGPSTTLATPFVQAQWTDRSTAETGFRISIARLASNFTTSINRPAADGIDSLQAATITDLASGNYLLSVCATFGGNSELCAGGVPFRIAAGQCAPIIVSVDLVGASTERVRWNHNCDNPSRFGVNAGCGDSPFAPVATTLDGTARDETFSIGVGAGRVEVCAQYPQPGGQVLCSARVTFQCN